MQNLIIANTTIRQDAEGRFCLNDFHRAAGSLEHQRPSKWMSNKTTQALIEELDKAQILTVEQTGIKCQL